MNSEGHSTGGDRDVVATRLALGLVTLPLVLAFAGIAGAQSVDAGIGAAEATPDDETIPSNDTLPEAEPPIESDASAGEVTGDSAPPTAGADAEPTPPAGRGADEVEAEPRDPAAVESPPPSWEDYLEIRGFGTLWVTPHRGAAHASSDRPANLFHLRFARVMVTAKPSPQVRANAVIGLEASNMILNFQLSYVGNEWIHISAGQYRIPFGAAISTPAFRLRNFDRPRYVYVMSKQALRDLGVTVHSPKGGIFDGAIEYAIGAFNGEGRIHEGISARGRDFQDYLFSGRLVFNPGTWFLPPQGRLALAGSLARAVDPAAGPDADTARENAVYHLGGRLTPFTLDRRTWLAGADLTFSAFGIWLQAEMMYLTSSSLDGSSSVDALAWSVEGGYLVDSIRTMLVGRFETLNRDLDADGTTSMTFSLGGRVRPIDHVYLGAYYLHIEYNPMAASNAFARDDRVRIELGIEFL